MERNCGSPFVETKFLESPRTAAEWEALPHTGGDVPELQESTPSMDVTRSVALVRGGGGDYIVRLDQEAIGAAQMQLTSELETAEFAMFRNPRIKELNMTMQLTLWPSGVLYAEHVLHARQKEFYEEVLRMKPDSDLTLSLVKL